MLIDVACSLEEVNLSSLFIVVKEKVKDWLVNSPLSIEFNSDQSGDTQSNLKNVLKSDNIFENTNISDKNLIFINKKGKMHE